MQMGLVKLPSFSIQYYEHNKKVDQAREISRSPLLIDGLFDPRSSNRFCLGYLENLRRKVDSFEYLLNVGMGVEFHKSVDDWYVARNLSKQPIFIMLKSHGSKQVKLEPGHSLNLLNLKPVLEHRVMPKKLGKMYDEYAIKVSFGKAFEKDNDDLYISPCWVDMSLTKIVDFETAH